MAGRSLYVLAGELLPILPPFVKTLLTRTLPLLLCIAVGAVLSWVSIYAFLFAVWVFHSVPAVRACEAVGSVILWPGKCIFDWLGGDQSAVFFDPVSLSGTNGLILGILFYCGFRGIWGRTERAAAERGEPRKLETKVNGERVSAGGNGSEPVSDSRLRNL